MKRVMLVGVVAFALVGGAAWRHTPLRSEDRAPLPKFRITIHTTASGFEAECAEGCAWTKQTYNCGKAATSCDAQIDQAGVGPAR